MIDCSITENFFSEKNRMCDTECYKCKLSSYNNKTGKHCRDFITAQTKEAVEIVQEWSNAHPQQTMRDKFFEMFPDAPFKSYHCDYGKLPKECPCFLGWLKESECSNKCDECWNRPYIEKECAK